MSETESHYKPNGHFLVPKGWGSEEWIINSEKYCGKILRIKKDKKTSWHYHDIKDEVMYVHDGSVKIIYGYEEDINHFETREIVLYVGDSFHVPTGMIHQIIALDDTELFEFSTQHLDDDSIRLVKGD